MTNKSSAIVAFAIEVAADDFYQQCDGKRIDYLFGQRHGLECEVSEELKRKYNVGFSRVETDRTIYLFYPLESVQITMFGHPTKVNVDRLKSDRVERWKNELRRSFDEILHLRYSEPEWKMAVEER
jgi:hypothetical protein